MLRRGDDVPVRYSRVAGQRDEAPAQRVRREVVDPDLPTEARDEIERIAGADRSATAAAVAERFGETWGQPMIVTGSNYPDGLAAAQWVGNDVLLFAEGQATLDALKKHKGEITTLYFVGGKDSIPYDRRKELCKAAGLS